MHFQQLKRRDFLTMLVGAMAGWSPASRAQQSERVRRIGVLIPFSADDPVTDARKRAFEQALAQLGWRPGTNLSIEYRLPGGGAESIRRQAAELVALAPDVIVTAGSLAPSPLLEATRTIPVVMTNVPDPVGAGWVQSLARPGGNATGFTNFEYSLGGKWVEWLKQVAPDMTRALILRSATSVAGIGQFAAVQSAAQSLGVEATPAGVRDIDEIEHGVTAFARAGKGGLIVTGGGTGSRRERIIALAARLRLPAIYPFRYYVVDGGLISYGPDPVDLMRRAAAYVDRILKGEKPADLPVQAPDRYELVINMKTAKALGVEVPTTLLARADEVIE
jgi:putative tryptophan/tyrosine transport system substrate-binding protein